VIWTDYANTSLDFLWRRMIYQIHGKHTAISERLSCYIKLTCLYILHVSMRASQDRNVYIQGRSEDLRIGGAPRIRKQTKKKKVTNIFINFKKIATLLYRYATVYISVRSTYRAVFWETASAELNISFYG
jgi:hypothetical protein